uniref:Uncharacterized protein n=1 Tax=Arundo donax TaxID=35708 RepID=A0A0A8Y8F8_ARUDO
MDMGGLGLFDLNVFGWALRMRWLWLNRAEPSRTWSGVQDNPNQEMVSMFAASLSVQVVNGR